jgi:uncharacterized protein
MISALYAGIVTHVRFRPRAHRLRYRMMQGLFDLDELDAVAGRLRFFSRNRFNLFAFHDADYGDGSATPLRAQIEAHLRSGGLEPDGGAIRVLTMPRILGHVFNPISTWYCHRADGSLLAMLYEVTNTFKDRHWYLIPVAPGDQSVIRQRCAKRLYVSPFMDMAMDYAFTLRPPGEQVSLVVEGADAEGPLITATFAGRRRELGDGALVRAFFAYPLLTLKVVGGIHWEALRLWLKGVRIRRHPAPLGETLTIGR